MRCKHAGRMVAGRQHERCGNEQKMEVQDTPEIFLYKKLQVNTLLFWMLMIIGNLIFWKK